MNIERYGIDAFLWKKKEAAPWPNNKKASGQVIIENEKKNAKHIFC